MFERTSALVIGLYVAAAILVVVMGYAVFSYYEDASAMNLAKKLGVTETSPAERPYSSAYKARGRNAAVYDSPSLERANERLTELQVTLRQTESTLQDRTRLLAEKTAMCESLQSQLDETIRLSSSLLASDQPRENAPSKSELEVELDRLSSKLGESELTELQQANLLDRLQAELRQSELELVELQGTSDRRLADLNRQHQALVSAATEALVKFGDEAVPVLVELLSEDRSDIRLWAAKTLGEIGPDAADAAFFLEQLRKDPSEDVRRQAGRSLAAIEQ